MHHFNKQEEKEEDAETYAEVLQRLRISFYDPLTYKRSYTQTLKGLLLRLPILALIDFLLLNTNFIPDLVYAHDWSVDMNLPSRVVVAVVVCPLSWILMGGLVTILTFLLLTLGVEPLFDVAKCLALVVLMPMICTHIIYASPSDGLLMHLVCIIFF